MSDVKNESSNAEGEKREGWFDPTKKRIITRKDRMNRSKCNLETSGDSADKMLLEEFMKRNAPGMKIDLDPPVKVRSIGSNGVPVTDSQEACRLSTTCDLYVRNGDKWKELHLDCSANLIDIITTNHRIVKSLIRLVEPDSKKLVLEVNIRNDDRIEVSGTMSRCALNLKTNEQLYCLNFNSPSDVQRLLEKARRIPRLRQKTNVNKETLQNTSEATTSPNEETIEKNDFEPNAAPKEDGVKPETMKEGLLNRVLQQTEFSEETKESYRTLFGVALKKKIAE